MSSPALETSSGPPAAVRVLRYLDLVVLALALPVFVVGGLPLLGYAVGAGVWLLQRAIQVWALRRARAAEDPRTFVGIVAGSMIGRGWLVALSILAAGLAAGDDVGLSAAVLVISLFTVYFTIQMILRPFDEGSASA